MGLKINTIAGIPNTVSRSYYLYILDYYNWDEPIGNTLRDNFDKIAEFAAKNDSVVIQGIKESHFYNELFSFDGINGMTPEELLPALMITTLHPQYFLSRDEQRSLGEPIPKDKVIFLKISEICKSPSDVIKLIGKIFSDIKSKKSICDFAVTKYSKRGVGGALVDSMILEPKNLGAEIELSPNIFDTYANGDLLLKEIKSIKVDTREIKRGIHKLRNELGKLSFIVKTFTETQTESIEKIFEELYLIDNRLINRDWNTSIFQESLTEIVNKLDKTSLSEKEASKVKEELNRSDITVKHKLKFVIPLIFLKYEGEMELSNKQKFPRTWAEWKRFFIKEKEDDSQQSK